MTLDRRSITWGVAAVATMVIANGVAPEGSMWQALFTGMWVSCALNFYRESRP